MLKKVGWSFLWHHYGTQPDSDTCGFRVVMLAMQWCAAKTLTGQLPRWFLAYCASILQMFAVDSTTLRSTVNTFQDATYEDALTMYDEPVIWAMTECGALPDVTDAELDADSSEHQLWTITPNGRQQRGSSKSITNTSRSTPQSIRVKRRCHHKAYPKHETKIWAPKATNTNSKTFEKSSQVQKNYYASTTSTPKPSTISFATTSTPRRARKVNEHRGQPLLKKKDIPTKQRATFQETTCNGQRATW